MDWFYDIKIQNKIITLDAQSFEDLFCKIMKENDDNFYKVKASGRKGDNKWKNIKVIHYVINDKFKGLPPDVHQLINELKNNPQYPKIELFSMEKLKRITLSLTESKKQYILGFVPDLTNSIATLQFSIVEEIIKYLEKNVKVASTDGKLVVPNFNDKIKFNHLSDRFKDLLNSARYQVYMVDEFFENNNVYRKEDLRNFCNGLYMESCKEIGCDVECFSDKRFAYILEKMSYDIHSKAVMDNVLIIIASFFESCDIFEEPLNKEA